MILSTIQSLERVSENKDFITYVLLVGLFILVLMKAMFFDVFETVFKLTAKKKPDNQLLAGSGITLVFVLFISLIVDYFLKDKITLSVFPTQIGTYFIILFSSLIFVILKNLFAYLFHIIIDGYESYYNISQIRITNVSWMMIVALCLILYYFYTPFNKDYFIYISAALFSIIKIVEWLYYLLKKFAGNNLQWYYKIVYLCTFEILPLAIILKILL